MFAGKNAKLRMAFNLVFGALQGLWGWFSEQAGEFDEPLWPDMLVTEAEHNVVEPSLLQASRRVGGCVTINVEADHFNAQRCVQRLDGKCHCLTLDASSGHGGIRQVHSFWGMLIQIP